jgi:glycosyltransferase involved in cell wall biosynthesis
MGTFGARIAEAGVPVTTLEMQRGTPSVSAPWRLARLLRREHPDILQTWLYHADFLGLLAGKLTRVPNIVWNVRCTTTALSRRSPVTRLLVPALAQLSGLPAAIVVNAHAGRDTHERAGYAPKRWEVIPNGFDLDEFRPDAAARARTRVHHGIPDDAVVLGLVGNYEHAKDHVTFLRAAGILASRRPNIHFVLAGRAIDTSNLQLARDIHANQISTRLTLLGERQNVAEIIPAFDIAVSSSREEGFANTIGEAMSCGVPCLVTDVGDSARVVGPSGVVVPPRDPLALASAAHEMIDRGPAALHRLGETARARIRDHYSLSQVLDRYEALYRALAGRD